MCRENHNGNYLSETLFWTTIDLVKIVSVSLIFVSTSFSIFNFQFLDADNFNLYDLLGTSLPSSLIADEDDDSDWLRRESYDPRDRILEKILDSEEDPFYALFAENDRSESDWSKNWSDKKRFQEFDEDFNPVHSKHSRSKKRDQERIRNVSQIILNLF